MRLDPVGLMRRAMARTGSALIRASEGGGTPAPWADSWYGSHGVASATGLSVTPQSALQVSAVFACVKVLSETLGMLPLGVQERIGPSATRRAFGEPTDYLLTRAPNAWQTPYEFKETLTAWAALHGNGYARKVFAGNGIVRALIPIHPSLVRLELVTIAGQRFPGRAYNADALEADLGTNESVQIRYMVRQPDGTERPFVRGEMLHIRGISFDAVGGVVVSRHAREAIGLAQAMEAFGARYFANDLTAGLMFEHPGRLGDKAYERLQRALDAKAGVSNAFKRLILEEGMKATRAEIKASDAQLTEARRLQIIEVCRFYRMPPHKIQHLDNATFSNIEHQGIEFGTDTIQPWAVRWEQAISRDLIVDDDRYYAEVNMNALMRGDSKARSEYYTARFNNGTLSRNEIRTLEGDNPVSGGDRFYLNSATVMLDEDGRPIPATQTDRRTTDRRQEPEARADVALLEPVKDAAGSFAVLLADAADRIALAESRELDKRAGKREEDPGRFGKWAEGFYAQHERYIERTLAPIAQAWTALGNPDPNVGQIARELTATAFAAAIAGAPQIAVADHLTNAFFARELSHAA